MTVGEWFDRHRAMAEAEALEKGLAEGRAEGRREALLDILAVNCTL